MAAGGAQEWEWPDALDALIASSQNHRLLFENEEVRVLDTCTAGVVLEPGTALWTHSLPPHTLENVGDSEIRVLAFEVKR